MKFVIDNPHRRTSIRIKIEAEEAIRKWDSHLPKVTSGAIPFIDVKSFGTSHKKDK